MLIQNPVSGIKFSTGYINKWEVIRMAKAKQQKVDSLKDCVVMHFDPESQEWKDRMARIKIALEANASKADKDAFYRRNI